MKTGGLTRPDRPKMPPHAGCPQQRNHHMRTLNHFRSISRTPRQKGSIYRRKRFPMQAFTPPNSRGNAPHTARQLNLFVRNYT